MMRLVPRTTLFVAFYVLTSAATAYAECAWVLWEKGVHIAKHDTLVSFPQPDGGTLERHPVCFPDTVDPRGPKGK